MASQLLITTQTKALTTWFFNLPLNEYIDNTETQSLNFESKTQEEQLEGQKQRKAQEGHLEEENTTKPVKSKKSGKPKKNGKEELRKAQNHKSVTTPPETNSL
jgi:hypothetical protein